MFFVCTWCCLLVQLHPERDLGVPIDVIDPRNYLLPKNPPPLAKEDEALLNWREGDVASSGAGKCLPSPKRVYVFFCFLFFVV